MQNSPHSAPEVASLSSHLPAAQETTLERALCTAQLHAKGWLDRPSSIACMGRQPVRNKPNRMSAIWNCNNFPKLMFKNIFAIINIIIRALCIIKFRMVKLQLKMYITIITNWWLTYQCSVMIYLQERQPICNQTLSCPMSHTLWLSDLIPWQPIAGWTTPNFHSIWKKATSNHTVIQASFSYSTSIHHFIDHLQKIISIIICSKWSK